MRRQMNHGVFSIEPQLTLKWTPRHLEMNPGALFLKLKKTLKKIHVLKNQNKKLEKPSILKYSY